MEKPITSFKEVLPKPSDAVQAMIDGLWEQSERDDFKVDMSTFWAVRNEYIGPNAHSERRVVCIGCAASCTVMKAVGINIAPSDFIHAQREEPVQYNAFREAGIILGIHHNVVSEFELMVDSLRKGSIHGLLFYYKAPYINSNVYRWLGAELPGLTTDNWKYELHHYNRLVKRLKMLGL